MVTNNVTVYQFEVGLDYGLDYERPSTKLSKCQAMHI